MLFRSVNRWCLHGEEPQRLPTRDPSVEKIQDVLPACVGLVPVLWRGNMDDMDIEAILDDLRTIGSRAAPGFMSPEGVVVYHTAANALFKKTLEKDDKPKSQIGGGF